MGRRRDRRGGVGQGGARGSTDLLESIELVAEVAELKANPNRPGVGVVVEAELDRNRGVLARILVQTGTLQAWATTSSSGLRAGRVKALVNAEGKRTHNAGPSMPVEVLGLSELPGAGDRLVVVPDEKTARATVAERLRREDLNRVRAARRSKRWARVSPQVRRRSCGSSSRRTCRAASQPSGRRWTG